MDAFGVGSGIANCSPEADQLDVLTLLIQDYESRHHPHSRSHRISSRCNGTARSEPQGPGVLHWLSCSRRPPEVLNRVRPLTLDMIRRLSQGLGLPAEVLVRQYRVRSAA
jgi:HTH-type transcriptional regulator / antitoxin HigA